MSDANERGKRASFDRRSGEVHGSGSGAGGGGNPREDFDSDSAAGSALPPEGAPPKQDATVIRSARQDEKR